MVTQLADGIPQTSLERKCVREKPQRLQPANKKRNITEVPVMVILHVELTLRLIECPSVGLNHQDTVRQSISAMPQVNSVGNTRI